MEAHPEVLINDDISWRIPDHILLSLLYEAHRGETPEVIMLRIFANTARTDAQ